MSIVSPRIDFASVPIGRRKRMFKSVQRSVPGSNIEFMLPRQVPTFNKTGKSIHKPFLYGDLLDGEYGMSGKCRMGYVPLKSLQEGSHPVGVSLFNAPIELIREPLKVPLDVAGSFDYNTLVADPDIKFPVPLDYLAGIRPSPRGLKLDSVDEPAAPSYRSGRSVVISRPKEGTYDVGSLEYQVLRK
jgi:hypothetical protein